MADESGRERGQNNQKTIAAFVAGLLVGGLLVWVFSAVGGGGTEPERAQDEEMTEENEEVASSDEDTRDASGASDAAPVPAASARGEGSLSVLDQPAGPVVVISEAELPTESGWFAVAEVVAGALGSVLGAARYDTAAGRIPVSVNLLRSTEAEVTYAVLFYSDNGDRVFNLGTDRPILGPDGTPILDTFTAR